MLSEEVRLNELIWLECLAPWKYNHEHVVKLRQGIIVSLATQKAAELCTIKRGSKQQLSH